MEIFLTFFIIVLIIAVITIQIVSFEVHTKSLNKLDNIITRLDGLDESITNLNDKYHDFLNRQ